MQIKPLTKSHAEATRQIFNYYVANTNATPERLERSAAEHASAIQDFLTAYVAQQDEAVIGFAFAKPYAKGLESFGPAVEFGVYLHESARGKGVGASLLKCVITDMKGLHKHTGIAKIDAENVSSIKLFKNLGFTEVARLHEVGEKNGKRITVVYMQVML